MSDLEQEIVFVMEHGPFAPGDYPEDLMRWVDIKGIKGRYSPTISHPFTNIVGVARLSEDNVVSVIEQVKRKFDAREQVIGWMTSKWSTPSSLETHLERAGFARIATGEGYALRNLNHSIEPNPKVTVRKATTDDNEQLKRLYRDAFPMPDNMIRNMIALRKYNKVQDYFAYLDGEDEPVSVASMSFYPNTKVAGLQGAATLEEFRGHGIYTSLMAKRLDDARAAGMKAAVMQADVTTSGPIVAKLGFEKYCDMDVYMYPAPPEDDGH